MGNIEIFIEEAFCGYLERSKEALDNILLGYTSEKSWCGIALEGNRKILAFLKQYKFELNGWLEKHWSRKSGAKTNLETRGAIFTNNCIIPFFQELRNRRPQPEWVIPEGCCETASLGMFALRTAICQCMRCNSDVCDTSEALYYYLFSVTDVFLTTTSPRGKEFLSEYHLSAFCWENESSNFYCRFREWHSIDRKDWEADLCPKHCICVFLII